VEARSSRLVREDALPMLHRFGIDVVGSGPSLDDRDLYCLLRAVPSAARRDAQLGSFYSSDEWRQNYGDTALALVDAYHIAVLPFAPLLANGERSDLKTP
jgi:hypothetical protein